MCDVDALTVILSTRIIVQVAKNLLSCYFKIVCDISGVTDAEKTEIVNVHNNYRASPQATDMTTMVWYYRKRRCGIMVYEIAI